MISLQRTSTMRARKAEADMSPRRHYPGELASKDPKSSRIRTNSRSLSTRWLTSRNPERISRARWISTQVGLKIAEAIAGGTARSASRRKRTGLQVPVNWTAGDYALALANYREAIAILTEQLNKTLDNATLISNIALAHRRVGREC